VAGDTILSNVNVIGASYDSVSFSVAGEEITPTDLFFSPDGLKMYIVGSAGDDVNEYNLSTAWVVSSAVFVTSFSVAGQDSGPSGLFFRADGTKMYMVGFTNDVVFQYTLSTPWSVATASYDNISFSVAGQEATPSAIWFRPNGLSMYIIGSSADTVFQYTLSTAWNVSTATLLQSFSISGQEASPNGMCFTGDGSRMFITGSTGDDVNVYNLTTPWDISTAAFVNVFSVAGQDITPSGIYIKPDGTKMYIVGSTNDAVYQYTVPSIDIQLTGQTSVAALEVQQDLTVYGNTQAYKISASNGVLVTSPAGLGYGTGSGGTVTQATSRTTGVTLSKPSGAITMFSAAGSATAATFTVTNTLVAATDTIILNQKSGTNLYVLLVTAVAAGSFNVTFYTTGGTATDAPVINFSLIKGVTA
jgi:sugar lactone lactonase YvrE